MTTEKPGCSFKMSHWLYIKSLELGDCIMQVDADTYFVSFAEEVFRCGLEVQWVLGRFVWFFNYVYEQLPNFGSSLGKLSFSNLRLKIPENCISWLANASFLRGRGQTESCGLGVWLVTLSRGSWAGPPLAVDVLCGLCCAAPWMLLSVFALLKHSIFCVAFRRMKEQ